MSEERKNAEWLIFSCLVVLARTAIKCTFSAVVRSVPSPCRRRAVAVHARYRVRRLSDSPAGMIINSSKYQPDSDIPVDGMAVRSETSERVHRARAATFRFSNGNDARVDRGLLAWNISFPICILASPFAFSGATLRNSVYRVPTALKSNG